MEVHTHPHTERKKFKHYLWEFLMLFLAVFCGFLAENQRERLVEHKREKEYIISMVEDLRTDSAFLALSLNKLIPYHLTWLDSTVHLFQMTDLEGKDRQIYQAFMLGTAWAYNFHPTQRTLSQLHSQGYNLIRNKNAANCISQLEAQYLQFNSQISAFAEGLQNDLDLSAWVFADRVVTDQITTTAFQDYAEAATVQLKLSDVPESARINTENMEGIHAYLEKLKRYGFYLQYGIKGGHVVLLREITNTLNILKREYHLK